jgi:hypothetical protein
VFHVEIVHDGEYHTPEQPFQLLAAARAWAAQKVAEFFRDAHPLDKDAAVELIDLIAELEGDGPWVRSDVGLDVKVSIWPDPPHMHMRT